MRHWRIKPDDYVGYNVERIAAAENRSLANCLETLLREAIAARRAVDRSAEGLATIINTATAPTP
jgi:hypothetical protein